MPADNSEIHPTGKGPQTPCTAWAAIPVILARGGVAKDRVNVMAEWLAAKFSSSVRSAAAGGAIYPAFGR